MNSGDSIRVTSAPVAVTIADSHVPGAAKHRREQCCDPAGTAARKSTFE